MKIKIKQEGLLPSISLGVNDINNNSVLKSEYIVASYGFERIDLSLGLGWGYLNSFDNSSNFLADIDKNFLKRGNNYFKGKETSVFGGASFIIEQNLLLKFEYDSSNPLVFLREGIDNSKITSSLEYLHGENYSLAVIREKNGFTGIKLSLSF